jgi:hypothetical protein
MTCLSDDELLELALSTGSTPEHLAGCADCARRFHEWQTLLGQVETAVQAEHGGDDGGRDRFLANLASEPESIPSGPRTRRFRWQVRGVAAVAASLFVGVTVLWFVVFASPSLAQTAHAMQEARGFTCDVYEINEGSDGPAKLVGRVQFDRRASRLDTIQGGRVTVYEIVRVGDTGIVVRNDSRDFIRTDAERRPHPAFAALAGLAQNVGRPEKKLGDQEMDGHRTIGFRLSAAEVIPDGPADMPLDVWIDRNTHLPVQIAVPVRPGTYLRLDRIEWRRVEASVFDVRTPEGYVDATPPPLPLDVMTERVIFALRTYAQHNDGRYPAVKTMFADQIADELRTKMGRKPSAPAFIIPNPEDKVDDPKDRDFAYATHGFILANSIQRQNADVAYHGRTVTAADTNKILFRWKLDDSRYRVIFGDLRTATVTHADLVTLERP